MHSSPFLMNAMVITGRIIKSTITIIIIALTLSLLGVFETNSQTKTKPLEITERLKEIKKSEEKIKHNIRKITTLDNGLNVYRFQYKTETTIYVGFLAHDLAKNNKFKRHVIHMGEGHYAIHHENLGFQTITLKTWQQSGIQALRNSKNEDTQK